MKNFKGNNRSDRGKGFSKRRDNDYGRPEMHQTKCNNCGKQCEVPFKPTSGKPIYCSSCFDKSQNDSPRKFDRDRDDINYRNGDSRKRSFGNNKENDTNQFKKEFGILNKKLDQILKILGSEFSDKN